MKGLSARMRCLHVRAGGVDVALPLAGLVEVCRQLPTEPAEGAVAGVIGVARWRGAPTPVVDLRALLGGWAEGEREGAGQVGLHVLLHVGERSVALAVTEVLGIVDLGADVPLPPLLAGVDAGLVQRLGLRDGAFVRVLDSARILPSVPLA